MALACRYFFLSFLTSCFSHLSGKMWAEKCLILNEQDVILYECFETSSNRFCAKSSKVSIKHYSQSSAEKEGCSWLCKQHKQFPLTTHLCPAACPFLYAFLHSLLACFLASPLNLILKPKQQDLAFASWLPEQHCSPGLSYWSCTASAGEPPVMRKPTQTSV